MIQILDQKTKPPDLFLEFCIQFIAHLVGVEEQHFGNLLHLITWSKSSKEDHAFLLSLDMAPSPFPSPIS